MENAKDFDLNSEPNSGVNCSICLDLVNHGAERRSSAKLLCGHKFHLDCIGSAFNMRGAMQCPNCREIENGHWLYPSGSTNSYPEFNMDDVTIDNHPVHYSFPDVPFRVDICPFHGQVHLSPEPNLGMMSAITPMANHHHPGWSQYGPLPYHPVTGLPISIYHDPERFDDHRSLPRFVPPGQVYEPSTPFSPYVENPPVNYSHLWVSDNLPYFPFY